MNEREKEEKINSRYLEIGIKTTSACHIGCTVVGRLGLKAACLAVEVLVLVCSILSKIAFKLGWGRIVIVLL